MSTRRWVDLILAGTARIRDITRVAAPAGSTPGHVVRVAADGESLELGEAASAGAPEGAEYLVASAHAELPGARAPLDTSEIAWDLTTAGRFKAALANVPTSKLRAPSGATAGHALLVQPDGVTVAPGEVAAPGGGGGNTEEAEETILLSIPAEAGQTFRLLLEADWTIQSARIVGDKAGSAVVDVKRSPTVLPFAFASITGAAKPTLVASEYAEVDVTSWTKLLAGPCVLEAAVESASGLEYITIAIRARRPTTGRVFNLSVYFGDGVDPIDPLTEPPYEVWVAGDFDLTGWTVSGNGDAGSTELKIERASYAGYPAMTEIMAAERPQMVALPKAQHTLGAAVEIRGGAFIRISPVSADGLTRANVSLTGRRV